MRKQLNVFSGTKNRQVEQTNRPNTPPQSEASPLLNELREAAQNRSLPVAGEPQPESRLIYDESAGKSSQQIESARLVHDEVVDLSNQESDAFDNDSVVERGSQPETAPLVHEEVVDLENQDDSFFDDGSAVEEGDQPESAQPSHEEVVDLDDQGSTLFYDESAGEGDTLSTGGEATTEPGEATQPVESQTIQSDSPQQRLLDSVKENRSQQRAQNRFPNVANGSSRSNRMSTASSNRQTGSFFQRRKAPRTWGNRNRSPLQAGKTYHYGKNRKSSGAGLAGIYRGSGPDGQRIRIFSGQYRNGIGGREGGLLSGVDPERLGNFLQMAGAVAGAYASAAQHSDSSHQGSNRDDLRRYYDETKAATSWSQSARDGFSRLSGIV